MRTISIACGCHECGTCQGTGKIIKMVDIKTMKAEQVDCPDCEGKDNFAKCYTHMSMFLDEDDRKRHESYQRKQA